jgi:DNA primase
VLLFDGDAAGQKAADRAIEVFFAEPVDVRICTLPDELDPDELLRQEGGRARFDEALAKSEDALRHFVRRFRQDFRAANGLSAQQQRIEAVLARLVELGFREMPGLRRTLVMSSLSSITGLSERDLEAALEAIKSPTPRAPAQEEQVEVRTERVYRPSLEEQGFAPPQARARRDAERGLLAILLAHPTLSTSRVKLDDGSSLPLTEAITPESFLDPESRQIFSRSMSGSRMPTPSRPKSCWPSSEAGAPSPWPSTWSCWASAEHRPRILRPSNCRSRSTPLSGSVAPRRANSPVQEMQT